MSNPKHTPGPWAITGVSQNTGNISVGSKAQRIVIADVTNAASFGDMLSGAMRRGGGGFAQSDCATQFANADLIAAAPDLLSACQAVVDACNSAPPVDLIRRLGECAKLCETAIAKASPLPPMGTESGGR